MIDGSAQNVGAEGVAQHDEVGAVEPIVGRIEHAPSAGFTPNARSSSR